MRVLYASLGYTPHDFRFLQAIAEGGDEVFHLMLHSDQGREKRTSPAGEQRSWSLGRKRQGVLSALGAFLPARAVLQAVSPEIVHAGPVHNMALLTALAWQGPQVSMSWGSDLLLAARSGLERRAARWALRRSDAFLGDCRAVADEAARLGFQADRMVIFPWGVDLSSFSPGRAPGLRKRLGWENAFVLLSTRAHEMLYGIETVMRGFIEAAAGEPALRLIMLGSGSRTRDLEEMVAEAGLEKRVAFEGQAGYEALPEYFRAADLYLSASLVDGSSVSLLEAMASGLPCLVSDIPGNREWIPPELSGWSFEPGDHLQLAAGIARAVHGRVNLAQVGARNRAIAEARADWSRNKSGIKDAYRLARAAWNERR